MNIQPYLNLFETKTRDNGEEFVSFKLDVINDDNQKYQKLSNVMRESDLDEDSKYSFTVEALEAINEIIANGGEPEDPEQYDGYAESPVYTHELLEWFVKGTNYTFVDDVLEEYGFPSKDDSGIITAIRMAYHYAWENHYAAVLTAIK